MLLVGDSLTELGANHNGGWCAQMATEYTRKVRAAVV